MSKVKSALGEMVDFEMMKIMADYGTAQPVVATTATANTVVNPNTLVRDTVSTQVSVLRNPEYVRQTVPVSTVTKKGDVENIKVDTVQQITITTPESIEEVNTKTAKKGTKNVD